MQFIEMASSLNLSRPDHNETQDHVRKIYGRFLKLKINLIC